MANFSTIWTNNIFPIVKNPKFLAILLMDVIIAFLYYSYQNTALAPYNRPSWLWYLISFEFVHGLNGILIYIPLLYAIYAFRLTGLLITWLLSILLILPHIISFSHDFSSSFANILALSIPLIVFSFIFFEIKWRDHEKKHLVEREAERQVYLSQVLRSQEIERQRIARELHDETTQRLLIIASKTQDLLDKKTIYTQLASDQALETIRDEILDVSKATRNLSRDLRPSILDNLGLVPALRWIVDKFYEETAIEADFIANGTVRKLNPEIEINLFRITQEALNNIRRHSRATQVKVSIEFNQNSIKLLITDNGIGFNISDTIKKLTSEGKMGIIGIQERVNSINGKVEIFSESGSGTRISLTLGSE